MDNIPLIFDDPRPILSIWYPGEGAGGYSTDPRWDGSTAKIVAYRENGQCDHVPFFAVYGHDGAIKARVPAQHVTVVYSPTAAPAAPTTPTGEAS
jgi:hypothetical protein